MAMIGKLQPYCVEEGRKGKYADTWNAQFWGNTTKLINFDWSIEQWYLEKWTLDNPYQIQNGHDISDTIRNLSQLSISEPNISVSPMKYITLKFNQHWETKKRMKQS